MQTWAAIPVLAAAAAMATRVLPALRKRRDATRGGLVVTIVHSGVSDDALTFTVTTTQTGPVPVRGVVVRAAVGGEDVAQLPPFDLEPDRNRAVPVAVPRPRLGTVVPEVGPQATLYGEPLIAVATGAGGERGTGEWRELPIVQDADPRRYEAMQRAWAAAGKTRKPM